MTYLDEYIEDLLNISKNLDKFVADTIAKNEGRIVGLIKNRLYQRGVDGDGKSLGSYSPGYEALKRKEGKRASHITLRDEGDFYKGIFAKFKDGIFSTGSTDSKTPSLVQRYGEGILKLNEQEQNLLIDRIIEQALQEHIRELGIIISAGTTDNFFSAQ